MTIGLAADHGGLELKEVLKAYLTDQGHDLTDFGADEYNKKDDYPDFVIPMARAVAEGKVIRGIAVCGSGVGAGIAANKVPGVRAAVVHEIFSARQGVEDDDMNVMCLGGGVVGPQLAIKLVQAFLQAEFSGADRHKRRLSKIKSLEQTR